MINCICAQCGNQFKADRNKKKYCSKSCHNASLVNRGENDCLNCGKHFDFPLSRLKKAPVLFCSRSCYQAGRSDRRPVAERFWEKVDRRGPDDCWIWQGAKDKGYGKLGIAGKAVSTHRISYEMEYGEIPEGLQINHKCDVRDCVNPSHLYAGTAKQNTRDIIERNPGGLFQPGELHHAAKLTEDQVKAIRSSGKRTAEIAKAFGISHDHVTTIRRGDRWKFLNEHS